MDLERLRNIGISAHIDSGKTTLSERVLFYAGRIHRMGEIRGDGATMDHMELERERGITITSAATTVQWGDWRVNLIDTPGHVDFTIEVERSLRVLDGAVLLLCAVGGVQAQSITIDRQMRRYGIPRLAFINKMDRTGADPVRVVDQLRKRLGCEALPLQLPIGKETGFEGMVDLVTQEAVYFDGASGENVRREPVPAAMAAEVAHARQHLLEALSMFSDELMELLLSEEPIPEALVHRIIREATLAQQITPVLMGTAYRNKGVQPLLDAVVRYLPSPLDCQTTARDAKEPARELILEARTDRPAVAMAFKIVEDPHGTLTFMRIYQGKLCKGESYYNQRSGRKERIGRLVRMHADQREEIAEAAAGDIVAVMGIDAASGDTYATERDSVLLQNMFVPEPVIQMAIAPLDREGATRLAKALQRFRNEDPTLRITNDEETGETLIAGMGELHLEVYVQRIRREYRVEVEVGAPKVSYREAPTRNAKFDVRHRKQTGGSGQYAHIVGRFEVLPEDAAETFLFEDHVTGGRIPKQYIPAVEKGIRSQLRKGPVAGYPVVGLAVHLDDGSYHEVDSSDMAFTTCAQTTMRENFARTSPVLLEPVMKIEIECPSAFQGTVVGDLTARRGIVMGAEVIGPEARIEGEVPLAETFGYSTSLRSMTQGQGTFTLEFARYNRLPLSLEREIIEARRKALV
ncbi:MAG: elongation factor G [Thermoguttaceae bacterium]|jgi:elongation factor G|nr:elongation factor G [Thermoguttaceae bacterium]